MFYLIIHLCKYVSQCDWHISHQVPCWAPGMKKTKPILWGNSQIIRENIWWQTSNHRDIKEERKGWCRITAKNVPKSLQSFLEKYFPKKYMIICKKKTSWGVHKSIRLLLFSVYIITCLYIIFKNYPITISL